MYSRTDLDREKPNSAEYAKNEAPPASYGVFGEGE
jgi:hypothetical protein